MNKEVIIADRAESVVMAMTEMAGGRPVLTLITKCTASVASSMQCRPQRESCLREVVTY